MRGAAIAFSRPAALALLLPTLIVSSALAETIFATSTYLTPGGDIAYRLQRFDSASPAEFESSTPITGPIEYSQTVTLEFDPHSSALYGFSIKPCYTLCPDRGVGQSRIDPQSGLSSFTGWTDFPFFEAQIADYDIDPQTRDLRFFGSEGRNFRFRLNSLDVVEDEPFDQPGYYSALAHTWPGEGNGGVETFAIVTPQSMGPHLARIGGPGGIPPASSGEVTTIGPLAVEGIVGGFDISPSGVAYLSTFEPWIFLVGEDVVNRLYVVDLATASVQELGIIGTPSPYEMVAGIALAPEGLGSVLEIPSLSLPGLGALVLLLAGAALLRLRGSRRFEQE